MSRWLSLGTGLESSRNIGGTEESGAGARFSGRPSCFQGPRIPGTWLIRGALLTEEDQKEKALRAVAQKPGMGGNGRIL